MWTVYEVQTDGSNLPDTAEEVALPLQPTAAEVLRMMETGDDGHEYEVHPVRSGLYEVWTIDREMPGGDWTSHLSHRVERGRADQ